MSKMQELAELYKNSKIDTSMTLPSRFQINMKVLFLSNVAKIKAVHFYEGKVRYDLELFIKDNGNGEQKTRINNVDSFFVLPIYKKVRDKPVYKKD